MDDNKMIDDLVKMLDAGMMQGVGHVNVDTDASQEETKNGLHRLLQNTAGMQRSYFGTGA